MAREFVDYCRRRDPCPAEGHGSGVPAAPCRVGQREGAGAASQWVQRWGAALAGIDRPGMEAAVQKGEEKLPAGRSSRGVV